MVEKRNFQVNINSHFLSDLPNQNIHNEETNFSNICLEIENISNIKLTDFPKRYIAKNNIFQQIININNKKNEYNNNLDFSINSISVEMKKAVKKSRNKKSEI